MINLQLLNQISERLTENCQSPANTNITTLMQYTTFKSNIKNKTKMFAIYKFQIKYQTEN